MFMYYIICYMYMCNIICTIYHLLNTCFAKQFYNRKYFKLPCRGKWQSTILFLLGKFYGQRSLAGYCPWGCKVLDAIQQLRYITYLTYHLKYSYESPFITGFFFFLLRMKWNLRSSSLSKIIKLINGQDRSLSQISLPVILNYYNNPQLLH